MRRNLQNHWERGRHARIFLKNAGVTPAIPVVFRACLLLKSFLGIFFLIILITGAAITADARDGNNGRIVCNVADFMGRPVRNALIRVVRTAQLDDDLENIISMRSDERGFFRTPVLPDGFYSLNISHQDYQPVATAQFAVDSLRSVSLEIVLGNLFESLSREDDPRNQDLRQVLRGASDRRLIFRYLPMPGEGENAADPFTTGGVMSIASGTPQSESYFLNPRAGKSGISSNFAFTEPLNSTGRVILSGQVDSGEGSFVRFRNTYGYRPDKNHEYSASIGYGRVYLNGKSADFGHSSNSFANLFPMADGLETFSFGVESETRFFNVLSVRYGIDYSRLHYYNDESFFSPSLRIALTPADGWDFEAFIASRPQNDANSVTLPNGEILNLAEPTFITVAGNQVNMSQARHYETLARRNLTSVTTVEFAFYLDYLNGSGVPVSMAAITTPTERRSSVVHLNVNYLSQKGLRFQTKHGFTEHLTGSVTYIYGESKEIAHDIAQETIASLERNIGNFMQQGYRHSIIGRVDAFIPLTRTRLIGMLRWNSGYPLTTLDRFFDEMDVGTKSANIEIKQTIPVPAFMYMPGRWEAVLELRNALNQGSRKLAAADGEIIFDTNPRSLRFGLNYSFQ